MLPPARGSTSLNLVTMGDYSNVSLRDFGLFVAALALASLAWDRAKNPTS